MAEATDPAPFDPFAVEVLLLLSEEAETAEKRLAAILAKDVKVQPQNVTKPLVTKPVWPYEMWLTNYVDSPSEFNRPTRYGLPLSCSSENSQPDHKSNRDQSSSLDTTVDSCESKSVCEESMGHTSPHTKAIASTEPLSAEGITDLLQRSVNMLSDLQQLLSIGTEKYFPSDNGRNETDSAEREQTQTTLQKNSLQKMGDYSKLKAVGEEDLQLPCTDDKSFSLGFDVGLNKSSEKVAPVYNKENLEIETKAPNLKSIPTSVKCEDVVGAPDPGPNFQSVSVVSTVGDAAFDHKDKDKEDTTDSTRMRSEETMKTKLDENSTGIVGSKGNQFNIEETEQDARVTSVDKVPKQKEKIGTFEVHHFKTELQSAVSTQSVLYKTVTKWLPRISIDRLVKTEPIKQLVRGLMNNTIQELQTKHHIFSKCYIIETGSMAEGTKIGEPDEFDFNVTLPMLSDPNIAELLYIKLGIQTRLHDDICDEVLSFLCQFSFFDSSYRHFLMNAYLLQVFRETVRKHLPHGWTMREESDVHMMRVFLKNQTLTLHLQCDPGFVLSIDVCFGIPLNAERLQTVYVADHTHALHLSFIQSECLRMNTGVVAVISRNPLVGARFFFQTEPYKFHGNKSAADCYKLAKHVARSFLPKINKNDCSLCEDTLIPSFYMKTVVFFMMDFYTEMSDWSETQLVNRLIEIFEIIIYGFLNQFKALACYTYINSTKLDFQMKYSPVNGTIKATVGLDNEKPCIIPPMEELNLASSHEDVGTAVKNYWKYMQCEQWTVGDLLQKLIELLYVLKFTETT